MVIFGPKPYFKKFFIILQKGIVISVLSSLPSLAGCSGHEKSERERLREQNARGEYIYRNHDEVQYRASAPEHQEREPYPWEKHK